MTKEADTHTESPTNPAPLDKKAYEKELERLQAELVELQQWVVESGARVVIIMEGRDAAGKGSAIKRITQYLNPRTCRIEALPAPSSREKGQWYFQRYVEKLPTAGEIVIFDRSWYNRAGVERVMGFCTTQEYRRFLHQAPIFERLLVEDGILLRKYWFSVSDDEQVRRFTSRREDPLRQWKLSPMDLQSITRWEDYSRAKDEMFVHTDIPSAPWYTVESEDKKRSRINVISHLLNTIPWEHVEKNIPEIPERPESDSTYERPPRTQFRYVPDVARALEEEPEEKSGKKSDKKKSAAKSDKKSAKKADKKTAKKTAAKKSSTKKTSAKKSDKKADKKTKAAKNK
ncbi:polyphosphate kinase 2 [Corynebacterium suicordis]|uniref:ADP/GDP-polyphosphate phosphotransferase n=1 Tax=Corynebacterium suicordis DSM 45110 TaxID=1121369 RepID=A0ABR9ZIC4_9CORY|nr:polyphosphate kinase 2 [Corynebacterium suicordis]MBF4553117.1 polyphosphate kinase 2 [Corynebacterium suicordis DSM 45110]MDR6277920.1 polyphosphate kinase 2 [Corynebacterium suicordis]